MLVWVGKVDHELVLPMPLSVVHLVCIKSMLRRHIVDPFHIVG